MTIKVYEVRRDGTIRMVREETEVDPSNSAKIRPGCRLASAFNARA
ncbi:hypothetical protein I6J39_20335 [Streptomyces californicus]|nr:hypothetical protein I6J39_20335 [Streptomyces californicus]